MFFVFFFSSSARYCSLGIPFVKWYEAFYIYGLLGLYLYTDVGHRYLGLNERLPFLPLLMTSLYCSVGVLWSWSLLYTLFIRYAKDETRKNL